MLIVAIAVGLGMPWSADCRAAAPPGAVTEVVAETGGGGDDATEDMSVNRRMSIRQIIKSGGWLMYVLSAMSVLALAFVIYFLVVLSEGQIAPRPLRRELVEKIRAGDLDDARRICEYHSCPLSSVALAALDYRRHVAEAEPGMVRDVIEGEGSRQAESIMGQTQYLLDIAVISPMVGLLGTVFGMLRAFSTVATDIASAKPVALAAGVSQALVTTAYGLIVGIPAMTFYAYFRRRASKLVSLLELASTDVLTAMLSRR